MSLACTNRLGPASRTRSFNQRQQGVALTDSSKQEYTVSPKDVTAPPATTQAVVQEALAQLGDQAELVAFHRDIGQAVVALPAEELDKLKAVLGPDFLVDPRSRLNIM